MRPRFLLLPPLVAGLFSLVLGSVAHAQRPYIGYVYPAGGQQGTKFQIRIGGQALNDLDEVRVSGRGVTARVVEYLPRLNPQELRLLQEQLKELREGQKPSGTPGALRENKAGAVVQGAADRPAPKRGGPGGRGRGAEPRSATAPTGSDRGYRRSGNSGFAAARADPDSTAMRQRIQARVAGFVQNPASLSIANLAVVEVEIAPDAEPGDREIRLCTVRGASNPMVFQVGTLREYSATPMNTSPKQVLGKEEQALRKLGAKAGDRDVELPCTVNGQLGPGEINRFHFEARKGQRLVFSAQCRHLIPYIADAVPGWFQAVLSLSDARGREIAYDDDYRFKPDPVILFTVPEDGAYTLAVHDAIYRGREDFIYRLSLGELPFVTSCFPLGGRPGTPVTVTFEGVNLPAARQQTVTFDETGLHQLTLKRPGYVSNPVPFAVDSLPDIPETEDNDTEATAQGVSGSVIVNGRIDRPNDTDVFRVSARAGDAMVVDVMARRLDSPLDSFVTLSDARGKIVALNDDSMDLGDGVNTHHADSYLLARVTETGDYFVRLTDRAHQGGPDYRYRLRIGVPQPDFELRVVPSSLVLRRNATTPATVYVLRKDGYDGPVRLALKDPPPGFSAPPVVVAKGQTVGRLAIRAPARATRENVVLTVAGTASIHGRDHVHLAVAAEDEMQAFLWRHLVPAGELVATVFEPVLNRPFPRRIAALPAKPAVVTATAAATPAANGTKQTFTKQQVASRLNQLRGLHERGYLTDSFYLRKVAECEAAQ